MTATMPTATARPVTAALAVPRVAPQRRWRPSLVWLGVALVIAGALIAWRVLIAVGATSEYVAVGRDVAYGATLTREDLITVRISRDPALRPIKAKDVDQVLGKQAATKLTAGTLLTQGHLTERAIPGPGEQLVGLGLPQNRVPAKRLEAGANVLLVVTAPTNVAVNDEKEPSAPPVTIPATVVDVRPGAKDGETQVNVLVAERDGPLVAARAADGRIVVLLTRGS